MSNTKLNRLESLVFHFSVNPPASPLLFSFHTFYLMVAKIPKVPKPRCVSGKGGCHVNRFTWQPLFARNYNAFGSFLVGSPAPTASLCPPTPNFNPFIPSLHFHFCMVYLMVAKTFNFQLPTFRFPLSISHFALCSVHVPLYILMGGT